MAHAGPLAVAASIAPIQSLVAGVMGEVGTPALLIPGGQSPHTFSLRPSTVRAIARADLIFRISPDFELALDAPLAASRGARIVDLIDTAGVTTYPSRDLGEIGETAERAASERVPGGDRDPHIWLDPDNARAMARTIAATLAEADPSEASAYRANEALVEQWLTALDSAMKDELAPVRARPFVVFHDGYQYFERHYRLQFADAVTEFPGRSPGALHILKVREEIKSAHASCVFGEAQFEPRLLKTVTEGLAVRTEVLDPLGADLAPGPALYFDVMRGLSHAFVSCLSPAT